MNDYRIMDELDRSEELLHKGLKEINDKGDLNAAGLETLGEILDNIKDLYEIRGKGMNMIDQYSGGWRDDMRVRDRSYGNSYRGMDYRHSGNDMMIDELHRKLDNAKSEQEREIIRGMIRDYER